MFERLKFRWNYFCDPPKNLLQSNLFPQVILEWSDGDDREPVLWKRRVRAVLFGYGEGWSLREAIIDVFTLGRVSL